MAKVWHSIQYVKATGAIIGRITGGQRIPDENFPPEAAQIAFEDDDKNTFPDVAMKRVNLDKVAAGQHPMECMELCPKLARTVARNDVLGKLQALDARTPRALREQILTGKPDALQAIEEEAEKLRAQLAALPLIA